VEAPTEYSEEETFFVDEEGWFDDEASIPLRTARSSRAGDEDDFFLRAEEEEIDATLVEGALLSDSEVGRDSGASSSSDGDGDGDAKERVGSRHGRGRVRRSPARRTGFRRPRRLSEGPPRGSRAAEDLARGFVYAVAFATVCWCVARVDPSSAAVAASFALGDPAAARSVSLYGIIDAPTFAEGGALQAACARAASAAAAALSAAEAPEALLEASERKRLVDTAVAILSDDATRSAHDARIRARARRFVLGGAGVGLLVGAVIGRFSGGAG
jgi:hypothetical protein